MTDEDMARLLIDVCGYLLAGDCMKSIEVTDSGNRCVYIYPDNSEQVYMSKFKPETTWREIGYHYVQMASMILGGKRDRS